MPGKLETVLSHDAIYEELARKPVPRHRFPVPGPRHSLPHRARRRAEAEGDLLHPRRRLSGRRDEARAQRADRRESARGGARHARPDRARASSCCYEKTLSNIQEVKARERHRDRGGHRGRRGGRARSADHVIEFPPAHELLLPILEDRPAAVAGVSHRRAPRLRRGSAAQSGQERHGRVKQAHAPALDVPTARQGAVRIHALKSQRGCATQAFATGLADRLHPAHFGVADDSGERRSRRGRAISTISSRAWCRKTTGSTATPPKGRTTCPRTSAPRSPQTQLSIPILDGRLALGTWQGIYLFEHRAIPHRRSVVLHLIGDE